MRLDLAELAILLTGDKSQLESDLSGAENSTRSWAGRLGGTVGALMTGVITGGAVAAAGAIVGIGAAAVGVSDQTRNAANLMKDSLGIPIEEAERFADVARNVYGRNFAASVEDAAGAVEIIAKQLKVAASDPALGIMTEKAIKLRDRFGVDVAESVDSVNVLMAEMGLSADQAFDFVARGFQRGLNGSDDFTDTIREYSNQFGSAGFSADQFFSILETGAAGGVLGTDKIADAVKEMGIILNEGGEDARAAFGSIGLNFDEIAASVSSGETGWGDYFEQIVTGLNGIDDPIERSQLQVALFGTMAEDLGTQFTDGLSGATTSLEDMAGAADTLTTRYDSFGGFFAGLWRRAVVAVVPLTDRLLEMANDALPYVDAAFTRLENNLLPFFSALSGAILAAYSLLSGLFGGAELESSIAANLGVLGLFKAWFDQNMPLIRQTVDRVLGAIALFWEENGAAIESIVTTLYENIRLIIETTLLTILDLVTATLQLINGDFEGAGATLAGVVTRIWTNINTIFTGQLSALRETVALLGPWLLEYFSDTLAGLQGEFTAIDWRALSFAIVTKILEGLSTLYSAMRGAARDAARAFGEVDWSNLGGDVISGIVRGVKNGAFLVTDAIVDVASGAYDAFRSWWDARSPSRKAETDLGLPITQGIAVGIRGAAAQTIAEMAALGGGMIAGLLSGVGDVGRQVGDLLPTGGGDLAFGIGGNLAALSSVAAGGLSAEGGDRSASGGLDGLLSSLQSSIDVLAASTSNELPIPPIEITQIFEGDTADPDDVRAAAELGILGALRQVGAGV